MTAPTMTAPTMAAPTMTAPAPAPAAFSHGRPIDQCFLTGKLATSRLF